MKIETARDKLLSNFEVYTHLKQIQLENVWNFTLSEKDIQDNNASTKKNNKKQKKKTSHLIDLEIITKDLSHYLTKTGQSNEHKVDSVVGLMLELNEYQLEKIEKLEILNHLPRSIVTLYAIVEECDQRFSENECESILAAVNEHFPVNEEEGGDAGEEQEGGQGEEEELMMDVDEPEEEEEENAYEEEELEHETYTRKTGDEVTIED